MAHSFNVLRVALHLVDRSLAAPQYSQAEVDLASFSTDDREALDQFFDGHLSRAWRSEEGERTRAAVLDAGSVVGDRLARISADPSRFFEHSKAIADRLHEEARKRNTSRGLLMVVWFECPADTRRFLGLFKMDPGSSDVVTLRADATGQYLLDLAVKHLEQVLPDPKAGVLKWAILPHPDRPRFDVKLKDDEGPADLALYFQAFLGCRPRLSPKQQVRVVLDEVAAYARENHPDENWQAAVTETVSQLKQVERVDLGTVEEKLEESGLEGVKPAALRTRLKTRDAEDLDFPASTLRNAKLVYTLDNGIVIRGPLDVMESTVTVTPANGGWEFVIHAGEYEKEYA